MDTVFNTEAYHNDFDLKGFSFWGENVGIKDDSLDFGVIASEVPAVCDAVFTQNRFPGAPILVGKKHVRGGLQAIVVNSKNANVYTGKLGIKNAYLMCEWIGKMLGISPKQVLPSSTGIIGKQLDMKKIRKGFTSLPDRLLQGRKGLELFARAIMTSDAYPKWGAIKVDNATLVGVVKGAGMIEPNMATMLAYFLTDAYVPHASLQTIFREVVDRSFNAITVDGDTSTSDTAVIMANGLSFTPKQSKARKPSASFLKQFSKGLEELAQYLAQLIVADGEGARKWIELRITRSRSRHLAEVIAKSVLNSPLVKTAIHGGDPNWGRIIMAIGKVEHRWSFDAHKVKIYSISGKNRKEKILLNPANLSHRAKERKVIHKLQQHFSQRKVFLEIDLGNGRFSKTFWGSDLGVEYVKYNSTYTS